MNKRLLQAIIILPGTVLVFIPGAILWLVATAGGAVIPAGPAEPRFWIGIFLGVLGIVLAITTTRLFVKVGEGTPAPWAPPRKLVVAGPYRYTRNPMITGVSYLIGAEALLIGSWHLAVWMVIFVVANLFYIARVEEPGLEKRFGEDYRLYKANVPRWFNRLRPWNAP